MFGGDMLKRGFIAIKIAFQAVAIIGSYGANDIIHPLCRADSFLRDMLGINKQAKYAISILNINKFLVEILIKILKH